ncbi:MAG: ROK family transcriptional regulator [Clostridia bacterium]|nr:ROK family transcriptional regulator [Clostridia bacterium]
MHNSRKEMLKKIFSIIRELHPVSRKAIAEEAGVSLMSVCNSVDTLDKLGLIHESISDSVKAGRPLALLSPAGGEFLILDMTKSNFEILLFSMSGKTVSKYLYMPRQSDDFFTSVEKFRDKLIAFIGNKVKFPLIGAGIIVPGRYDRVTDTVIGDRSGNFDMVKLGAMLFDVIPCQYVEVEEDLTMGALRFMHSRKLDGSTLYIKCTDPCGAVLISNGKLHRGTNAGLPGLGFDPITADKEFVNRYFDNISLFSVADMVARSLAAYMTLVTPDVVVIEHDPLFSDMVLKVKITELLRSNYLSPFTTIPELYTLKREGSDASSGLSKIIIGKYLDLRLSEI